ncbi:MAG: indolepyruvate ferredoxin oxidoreductase family protein, partial [Burkholderiales bacterium]
AGARVTYKLLYNDAVAMTGGQAVDGPQSVPQVTRQLAAEGVQRIAVVSEYPERYDARDLAAGVAVHDRAELDAVQDELRAFDGVSVLIYDQTCAAEKRRRRKKGACPDPARRLFINDRVCEGCGDCSVKSNCLSVEPLETELGRKRAINQSSCNKDFSCVNGFCPSFVTVEGGRLKKGKAAALAEAAGAQIADAFPALPEPALPSLASPWGILVTGIGGTGVITIGQIIAVAAHIEGKGVSVLDMSGLAQKYGAVMSHVKIAAAPEGLHAARLGTGEASLVIGCDLVVTAGTEALGKMAAGRTRAAVNGSVTPTAEFVRNPNWQLPGSDLTRDIAEACGAKNAEFVPATDLAAGLMGDAIATNMFMLGYCWQKGWLPLARESLERAIELNGVAVEFNRKSFLWGRRAALDLERVRRIAVPAEVIPLAQRMSRSLEELVERRVKLLTGYQDAAYAARYRDLVERVRRAEQEKAGSTKLAEAAARYYAKLMAYKDEYEVARLYAEGEFMKELEAAFEGDYRLVFHLAPPLLARPDPRTGEPKKMRFGPWMMSAFRLLAKMKGLRGTWLDPFGRTGERRAERALISEYEQGIERLIAGLTRENHALAVEIASLPEEIRGYGHIKAKSIVAAREKRAQLLARWPGGTAQPAARAAA